MNPRSSVAALVAALLAIIAHLPALQAGFLTLDDPLYVTHNPRVLTGPFLALWSPADALAGRFLEFFPLRDSVYWLLAQVLVSPLLFHAAVIACHAAVSALVVITAARLGCTPLAAGIAGALFAVHPAHVESVAWVSALKDPMFFGFELLALLAYVAWDDTRRPRWLALSLVALTLSLLCKSLAIVFPGIVFAHALILARRSPLVALGRAAPFAVVAVAFTALFVTVAKANTVIAETAASGLERVALAAWLVVRYAALLVWPARLRIWHSDDFLDHHDWRWPAVLAVWVAAAVLARVAWQRERERVLLFFAAFFALSLLPVLNLIPFAAVFADRYAYAPSFGALLVIAVVVARLPRTSVIAATALIVVGLGALSWMRTAQWGSEVGLWEEVVSEPAGAFPQPWLKLGEARAAALDPLGSAEAFAQAVALTTAPNATQPLVPHVFGEANYGAALGFVRSGHADRAAPFAETAAKLMDDARTWELAARVRIANGAKADAVAAVERAFALSPRPDVGWNLGLDLIDLGDPRAAELLARAVLADARLCRTYEHWVGAPPEVQAAVKERIGDACEYR